MPLDRGTSAEVAAASITRCRDVFEVDRPKGRGHGLGVRRCRITCGGTVGERVYSRFRAAEDVMEPQQNDRTAGVKWSEPD